MHTTPGAPLRPYIHLREGRPRLVAIAMYVVLLQLYSNDDHLGKVSFDTIMYFVQAWSYPAMHETPIWPEIRASGSSTISTRQYWYM